MNKNEIRFSLLKSKVQRELGNLDELSDLVECSLRRRSRTLANKLNKESAGLSKREKEELAGWYVDDFVQLQDIFPRIQRYALFTTLMATVESNIIALCHAMHSILGLSEEFSKPKSNVISKALKYLQNKAGVDISRFNHYLDKIDMFKRIRNCIVHSEGKNTDSKPEEIEEYCRKIPTLEIDTRCRIILKDGFVDIALHEAKSFFDRLFHYSKKGIDE